MLERLELTGVTPDHVFEDVCVQFSRELTPFELAELEKVIRENLERISRGGQDA